MSRYTVHNKSSILSLNIGIWDLQGIEYSENNNPVTVSESAVDLSGTVKVLAQEQWVRVIIN